MINASEAREDDESFKNPVDVMFDELEAATLTTLRSSNTANTSWRREKPRSRS